MELFSQKLHFLVLGGKLVPELADGGRLGVQLQLEGGQAARLLHPQLLHLGRRGLYLKGLSYETDFENVDEN